MDTATFLVQCLNAVQYGLLLFLVASGPDADLRDHGRHQPGARQLLHARRVPRVRAARRGSATGSSTRLVVGVALAAVFGYLLEWVFFSFLYERDHLQQVLLTYALILVFEELRSLSSATTCTASRRRRGSTGGFRLGGLMEYPWYRVFASAACLVVALALYAVVNRTRLGMMIRAGASNRDMVRGLGVDIRRLYRIVFAGGVALAALAGMIAAPLSSVYPGMGSSVLIICFVVVVIGGIGSITGALIASLLVGFVDTFGKVFFAEWSGVGVYVLMAIVLIWRPEGLMKRGF